MKKTLAWCRKYLSIPAVLILGVIAYILFLQDNSVNRIYTLNRTIDSLRTVIRHEEDTLAVYAELNRRLDLNDPEIIERVVREHHNMSLPDEDVYEFK